MAARILIVDDNEVVRGIIGEALSGHEGWEVCASIENGEQAVAKARELNPDLIILDLAMPVMDGLRATREITKILPSVPIVIYTLHYAEWVVREAKKAGARAVVSKSDATKLVSVAEDLLQKKSSVAVAGAPEAHVSESLASGGREPAADSREIHPEFKPGLTHS